MTEPEKPERMRRSGRGLTAISGALSLLAVLLIAQMWLLTASLESYLGGDRDSALAGAIVSGILFAACVGLYLFVARVDAERDGD